MRERVRDFAIGAGLLLWICVASFVLGWGA